MYAKKEFEFPKETSCDDYQAVPNEVALLQEDVLTSEPKELISLIVAENRPTEIREERDNLHLLPSPASTTYKGRSFSL